MRRLGLDRSEQAAFEVGLCFTHERLIEVQVLTLSGRVIRSMTPVFVDGEVTVDVKRKPTRMLDITFLDPSRTMAWDPDDPGEAPLNRSRMIRVIDHRLVPTLGFWVECPIFTGPVTDFERQGAEVKVVAEGKEVQAMGNRWNTKQFRKKTPKVEAIERLLVDTGEYDMRIPSLRATLPKRVTVSRMDLPWDHVVQIVESMDRHATYDGNGTFRMRRIPQKPCATIDAALLAPLSARRDVEGLVNRVWVVGGNPKGPKKRVQAQATVGGRHENSPRSLARGGEPLRHVEKVENRNLKSKRACKRRARRLRDDRARVVTDYSFEMLPWPHFDELDLVAVVDPGGTVLVRMKQWTIPLSTTAAPMPVGTSRRTKPAKASL